MVIDYQMLMQGLFCVGVVFGSLFIFAWHKGQLGKLQYKKLGIFAACTVGYIYLMSTGIVSKSMNSILVKIWIIVFCARLLWQYMNRKKGE
ncbi:MAG: hypothetical protein ACJAZS_000440 [Alteromonas naphthalenivorans]|jgi:hypothetical protein